jgi:hypothetical protein
MNTLVEKTDKTDKTELYESLAKDVILLNEMFTDLNYIVKQQGEKIDSIEDFISTAKQDVKHAHKDLVIANEIVHSGPLATVTNLTSGAVGAGLGALFYLYNPHIAIGTIIIGGYLGWTVSDKIQTAQIDRLD